MPESVESFDKKTSEYFIASPDEAMDYFVGVACGSPNESTEPPKDVIKAAAESILLLHSEDLQPKAGDKFQDRNEIIKTIDGKTGIPRKVAELRDVRDGPLARFNKSLKGDKTEASRSSKSRYKRMDDYREDSLKVSRMLNGMVEVADVAQTIPDIDNFKHNDDAMRAVADYLQAKTFLDQLHWPAKNTNQYKNSYKYFYGAVAAAVRYGSPSVLAIAINKTRYDSVSRLRYWTEQMGEINKTVGGQATRAAIAFQAESQLVADESAEDHNDVEEITEQYVAGVRADERNGPFPGYIKPDIKSFAELIPDDVKSALDKAEKAKESRRADFEAEYDKMQSPVMPGIESLRNRFPEIYEDDQEPASVPEIRKGTGSKKNRTRRGLGSRQLLNADGPPEDIPDSRRTY